MTAVVAEIFTHRAAGVWCKELHRRRVRRRRGNYDGVVHRAEFLELLPNLGNSRLLLADRNVDANYILTFLIYDRVDRHSRFARLAVAANKLPLSAADGHHRIDSLQAGLKRLLYGLAINDSRRDPLDG